MNITYSYFENTKNKWTEEEEEQLLNYYNEKKYDIIKIGTLLKRAPGSITAKLKVLKIIKLVSEARGYDDYKKSDLYKEAIDNHKKKTDEYNEDIEKDIMKCFQKITVNLNKVNSLLENYKSDKEKIQKLTEEIENLKKKKK